MDKADVVHYVVAHLYQRSGRRALSENELVNAMSLDLKWYPPKDARSVVAAMAREGHLRRNEEGELEPTHDVREVKVPLGFRPPPELARGGVPESKAQPERAAAPAQVATAQSNPADAAEATPAATPAPAPPQQDAGAVDEPAEGTNHLGTLLDALAERTGEGAGVWVQRMDAGVQASADSLTPEAALLLAAAEAGVDVKPWLAAARAAL